MAGWQGAAHLGCAAGTVGTAPLATKGAVATLKVVDTLGLAASSENAKLKGAGAAAPPPPPPPPPAVSSGLAARAKGESRGMAGGGGETTGGAASGGEGGTGVAATAPSFAGRGASGERGGGGAAGARPLACDGLGSLSHGAVTLAFWASESLPHAAPSALSTSPNAMLGLAFTILGRSAWQKIMYGSGRATPWARSASSTLDTGQRVAQAPLSSGSSDQFAASAASAAFGAATPSASGPALAPLSLGVGVGVGVGVGGVKS